jgi:chemotaxis protein histidine kinase CheA
VGNSLKTPEQKMEAAKQSFLEDLAEKLEELSNVVDLFLCCANDKKAIELLTKLNGMAHQLAGTAIFFGFNSIGDLSGKLELFCKRFIGGDELPCAFDKKEIQPLSRVIFSNANTN